MGDGNSSTTARNLPLELKELIVRNLPTFDGTQEKWLFFKREFMRSVHNEESFIPVEKYCLLLKSLKGEARSAVQFTSNYEAAWSHLLECYDNIGLLTDIHLKALLHDLPYLPDESPEGLRHIWFEVLKNRNCLEMLGHPVEHWDTVIIFAVCSKLDTESHRAWLWEKVTDKNKPKRTLKELLDFLQKRIQLLEHLKLYQRNDNECNDYNECPLCQDDHLIYSCPNFLELDPKQRFREVKRIQICSNCLKNDHETKDCGSEGCDRCGRKHHTLLHFS